MKQLEARQKRVQLSANKNGCRPQPNRELAELNAYMHFEQQPNSELRFVIESDKAASCNQLACILLFSYLKCAVFIGQTKCERALDRSKKLGFFHSIYHSLGYHNLHLREINCASRSKKENIFFQSCPASKNRARMFLLPTCLLSNGFFSYCLPSKALPGC